MLEWLSELNWWGGFGALCGIAIVAIFMHHAVTKSEVTSDGEPAK